ncbi:DMT family transporter [Streptomyces sp. NPDC002779]|uniref:EamA family transporter n=1 Tax=Streptomyces sp. NPDC002779 TaxID=3364664 RepID=UPI0036A35668
MALASAFCFGGAGPAAKAVIETGLTPLQTVWLRLAGAAVVLLVFMGLRRRRSLLQLTRNRRGYLITYGLLSIAGVQVCYFVAVSRLPVSTALLLEYLAPVVVIAWFMVVRRVRLPASAWGGAVIAICGIAVVVQFWSGMRLDAIGLAAGLGAAACQASFFLLSATAREEIDTLALITAGTTIGAVAVGVFAQPWDLPWGALGEQTDVAGVSLPVWALVAWIVLVSTVLAYVCGIAAIRLLSSPVAGVTANLEVVVAALIAWIAIGEKITTVQILGGLLVLFGALLAQRKAADTT